LVEGGEGEGGVAAQVKEVPLMMMHSSRTWATAFGDALQSGAHYPVGRPSRWVVHGNRAMWELCIHIT